MISLLKELTSAYGPSSCEGEVRGLIEQKISSKVDEMYTDTLGNLIAIKKAKGNAKKIMLAAHMDEIGLVASYIDDKGFIRVSNIGGVNPYIAVGQRVQFQNGVMGCVCYEENLTDFKDLKLNKIYIDIGTNSKELTSQHITPGDIAVFYGETVEQSGRFISKALDDRIGCSILIKLIEQMQDCPNEVIFVFTVQEEVGLRGAGPAAYSIRPDIAVAVDVTGTGDTPECKPLSIELGKGPTVMIKDNRTISHPIVKDALIECAKQNEIPYQLEVMSVGGNDAGTIHTAAGGVPTGAVSIPCRYLHRPCEMVDKADVENAIKLLNTFVMKSF